VIKKLSLSGIVILTLLIGAGGPAQVWAESLKVEDFSQFEDGAFPQGWRTRGKSKTTTYIVRKQSQSYLEGKSENEGPVQIAKKVVYRIKEYPYLSWEWRVIKHPAGADERSTKTGDSAAAIYVILAGAAWPNTIKYVWSASVPKGTRLKSPFDPKTKMVVLRSKEDPLNQWVKEKVNVLEDLKEFFPRHKGLTRGIAFMTDSDNTESSSEAHVTKIVVSTD
jgi:hypothetical protein